MYDHQTSGVGTLPKRHAPLVCLGKQILSPCIGDASQHTTLTVHTAPYFDTLCLWPTAIGHTLQRRWFALLCFDGLSSHGLDIPKCGRLLRGEAALPSLQVLCVLAKRPAYRPQANTILPKRNKSLTLVRRLEKNVGACVISHGQLAWVVGIHNPNLCNVEDPLWHLYGELLASGNLTSQLEKLYLMPWNIEEPKETRSPHTPTSLREKSLLSAQGKREVAGGCCIVLSNTNMLVGSKCNVSNRHICAKCLQLKTGVVAKASLWFVSGSQDAHAPQPMCDARFDLLKLLPCKMHNGQGGIVHIKYPCLGVAQHIYSNIISRFPMGGHTGSDITASLVHFIIMRACWD
eukprot:6199733-Amphidinium_carterae.2